MHENVNQIDYGLLKEDKLMKKWLGNYDVSIYSKCNVGKSVVTKRFIKT